MTKRIASKSPSHPTQGRNEGVGTLFSELELAIKWGRPSILIAVYADRQIRRNAERSLARRLARLGQKIRDFRVSESQFDIPAALVAQPDKEGVVFMVSGLRQGDGALGARAYKALNIRREYLVDHKVRAVFWLSEAEAVDLPRRAPDFWAFRHRVVDFVIAPERKPAHAFDLAQPVEDAADLSARITYREHLLHELDPEDLQSNFDLCFSLGSLLWRQGEYEVARTHLTDALQQSVAMQDDRRRILALVGLGIVLSDVGDPDGALEHLRAASDLDQSGDFPLVKMSDILFSQGQVERASEMAARAVDQNPGSVFAWNHLGWLHGKLGRLTDAILAFETALKHDVRYAEAWYGKGLVQSMQGQGEAALQSLREACRLHPARGEYWQAVANQLFDLGQYPAALRAARKAVRVAPDEKLGWLVLGSFLQSRRRYKDAAEAFTRALALDPQDLISMVSLSGCYSASGKGGLSQQWLDKARLLLGSAGEAGLACYHAGIGEKSRSMSHLKEAAKKDVFFVFSLRHVLVLLGVFVAEGFAEEFLG